MSNKKPKVQQAHLTRTPPTPISRVWTTEPLSSEPTLLYFAYGSNLNRKQMKERCPDSIPLCEYYLPDFALRFCTHCDIEAKKGGVVHGAIYAISPRDEAKLDRYEGYSRGSRSNVYDKRFFDEVQQGVRVEVMYYTKRYSSLSCPSTRYWQTVLQGYADWELPTETLYAALGEAEDDERIEAWERVQRINSDIDLPRPKVNTSVYKNRIVVEPEEENLLAGIRDDEEDRLWQDYLEWERKEQAWKRGRQAKPDPNYDIVLQDGSWYEAETGKWHKYDGDDSETGDLYDYFSNR